MADALGRPMAILRIGSRVPEQDNATGRFLFDSPPWIQLPTWIEPPTETTPDASQPAPTEAAPNTAPTTSTDTTRRPSAAVGATR